MNGSYVVVGVIDVNHTDAKWIMSVIDHKGNRVHFQIILNTKIHLYT